jgi:proteasome accessory factor C
MARFERVSEIYEILAGSADAVSLDNLCLSLDVSPPTVKRLIRFLRDDLQVGVEYDRTLNGYRLDPAARSRYAVVGPSYDSRELSALLGAYEVLEQIPPGLFRRETASLRNRLQQLLYKRPTGHRQLKDRVRLVLPQVRSIDEAQFHLVLSALSTQRRLRIGYRSRSRNADTQRLVSPQRLTFYRSNWYLAAWCHRAEDLRIFAVDRVDHAEVTPIPSLEMPGDVLDARLSSAYGIFEGQANAVAVLRFGEESARWVADEQWHPGQQTEPLPDGGVILRVPYRHATELKMDILRYGADVEVLAPPELRELVCQSLERAVARYRPNAKQTR